MHQLLLILRPFKADDVPPLDQLVDALAVLRGLAISEAKRGQRPRLVRCDAQRGRGQATESRPIGHIEPRPRTVRLRERIRAGQVLVQTARRTGHRRGLPLLLRRII